MGSVYIIMMITIVFLLVILLMIPLRPLGWCVRSVHDRLKAFFLWNFVIRLVFEACLELTFAVIIDLPFAWKGIREVENWLEGFDFALAMVLTVVVVLLPFFILYFYCKNFEKLGDEKFAGNFGSVYEGLHLKRSALFYPIFFIVRRASLALVALFYEDFVWLQVSS